MVDFKSLAKYGRFDPTQKTEDIRFFAPNFVTFPEFQSINNIIMLSQGLKLHRLPTIPFNSIFPTIKIK